MLASFIETFRAFAVAEGDRDPELARPMALLADGLDHVMVAQPTPQTQLPLIERHFEAALAAGAGAEGDEVAGRQERRRAGAARGEGDGRRERQADRPLPSARERRGRRRKRECAKAWAST